MGVLCLVVALNNFCHVEFSGPIRTIAMKAETSSDNEMFSEKENLKVFDFVNGDC